MDKGKVCEEFNKRHYWLIPAVTYSVLVSFLQKRRRKCALDYKLPGLNQHFGLPVPCQFLSTNRNRWGFALAFGAIFNILLDMVLNYEVDCASLPKNIWIQVPLFLLLSVEVALIHYPMFICLSMENKVLGSILGLLYSLAWFLYQLFTIIEIDTEVFQDEPSRAFPVPSLICCCLLVLRYLHGFFKALRMYHTQRSYRKSQSSWFPLHNIEYVKCLLQPSSPVRVKPWYRRLLYDWDSNFHFPAGMLTMAVVSLIGVYTVSIRFLMIFIYFNPNGTQWNLRQMLSKIVKSDKKLQNAVFSGIVLTAMMTIYHIFSIMRNYRTQMKMLYKGDHRGLPRRLPASHDVMARSIAYISTQVSCLLSSMMFVSIFFTLCVWLLQLLFTEAFLKNNAKDLLNVLLNILGSIIPFLLVFFILKATMHRFFLQDKLSEWDKEKPLALNNLRALENLSYFSLFYYLIVEVVKLGAGILSRTILGCLTLGRIDRTTMPAELPRFLDSRYWTWVSMLLVNAAHTNPTAFTFCHLLLHLHVISDAEPSLSVLPSAAVSRARRRWWLCYTLVRNPRLMFHRKPGLMLDADGTVMPPLADSDPLVTTRPLLYT